MPSTDAFLAEAFFRVLLKGGIEHALHGLDIVISGTTWPALAGFFFRIG